MNTPIPILMYHQVIPQSSPVFRKYAITPRAFAQQMAWLARAGYSTINLDMLLAYRRGQLEIRRRPVIITFDDGYRDLFEHAVPILESHGFTAVFYLVTGLMGRTSRWLVAERGVEFPVMDWDAARQLSAAGFACGAHTVSHPRLPNLPEAACRGELVQSRLILEEQLGHEVRHLAYPFGRYSDRVRAIAAESGYQTACSVDIGISTAKDDVLALHRVPVSGYDSLVDFIWRLRTAYPLGEWLRGKCCGALRRLGRQRREATQ